MLLLLLSLLFVNSLQFSLHNPAKWNLADRLTAKFRMIKAKRHELRTDGTAADVIRCLPLTRSCVLNHTLHFLTSGSGASCAFSTVKCVDQRLKAPMNCLFSRAKISHSLLMLICILHHFRNHLLQVSGVCFRSALN